MATYKLVIRENKKNAQGECIISVLYTHNQVSTLFSTGQKILPGCWDRESRQVVKSLKGYSAINSAVETKKREIQKIANLALAIGIDPTIEYVREKYEALKPGNPKDNSFELFSFIEKFITDAAIKRKPSTIAVYRTTLSHLRKFEQSKYKRGKKLTFDAIGLDFYQDFTEYLTDELGFTNNTVGKYIKDVRTFLTEATEQGLNQKMVFKSKRFKVLRERTDAVYLNEKEIAILNELDLSKQPRLARVRDIFVIGCWVGLRFSDLKQVRPDSFVKDDDMSLLRIRAIKTGEAVYIPLHPMVESILMKYDGNLPPTISNQKMNDYIKEVCQLAGMDTTENITTYRGAVRIDEQFPKYKVVSTHTARRSFATNLFLQGVPTYTIMKITGHRTEQAFIGYVKVSALEHAKILKMHWELQKSLKVVK